MEGSSSPAPYHTLPTGGASKFLANLPSTGLFSSTIIPTNMGRMRVYITDHETAPPENQLIKTDQMNILIRSLVLKQQKGESSSKSAKGASDAGRKRAAEKSLDSKASTKRAVSSAQSGSRQEVSKSRLPDNLHSLTVERLRALLKERNHSTKGKKDELIARLRAASTS